MPEPQAVERVTGKTLHAFLFIDANIYYQLPIFGESIGMINICVMKLRKKELLKLLLASGLMMSPLLSFATAEPKVVVETTTGSLYEFYIADNPRITYQDNLLVIQNEKDLSVSVNAADVKTFKFYSSSDTAIDGVEIGGKFGSKMSGLKAGSSVSVFTADGKTIQKTTVGEDGNAEIDFSKMPKGVYVVKTEKGSIKIQK